MTITNTWAVVQMDAYPEYEGATDVVFTVHWTLNRTDGEYAVGVYGSQGLTLDPEGSFMPYEDLTQEQVIGWVHNAMGEEQVAAYEAAVIKQIDEAKNPPVVNPPLPWASAI